MKYLLILLQLIPIYLFFFAGEWLRAIFDLPMPGSIVGFVLLFTALAFKIYPLRWIESGARMLLAFLPLYFIPATVGIVDYGNLFAGWGIWLIPIVAVSTLLTMASAGLVSQFMAESSTKEEDRP
ncbi:MAG TPA: CidA/LrgA family protein [Planococcus sp. (in: firmicutes)]|nr:CidA/LrgA family protein [Planococcus sp. (in: firmicutes)]